MAPSDFQNFFEVATGPCKNAVNRACGHFLSSLFSLLSFFCSLPSSLLGTDPFRSHAARPMAPQDLIWDLSRPHLGISGGLFWHLFSLLSSLFSLLSSLFPLLPLLASSCSLPASFLFLHCLASCWLDASCPAGEAAAFLLAQRDVPRLQLFFLSG